MRTLSIKVTEDLERKLGALARRRRTTRSNIVREALEAYSGEPDTSFTATAGDLCGSLAGPRDLSANPKRMVGYGK